MHSAMTNIGRTAKAALCLATALFVGIAAAGAGTFDNVRKTGTLKIAYRADAPPFSYKDAKGRPAGFMVELCQAVAAKMAADMRRGPLQLTYVQVSAANRFDKVVNGDADVLCEPTSETLSRRALVDFSIATFVDGAGMMIRDDGPHEFKELAGKKVGVLAGTTTEQTLRNSLQTAGTAATVTPVKTHSEGIDQLDNGAVSAYFADRSILMFLVAESSAPKRLRLAEQYLTVEPYALAMAHGDEDFRLAVDRALSHIYRSGEITEIFAHTFHGKVAPTETLRVLYLLSGLPD
jgi:ABC-type amino acid transport substrate-binding protein